MGMYDSIFVKKKLPLTKELKELDIKWDEVDFQTKDLENALDTYEITKSGKLRHLWQEREWQKDEEDSFLGGYLKVINEEWRDVDYHGTINFYTYYTDEIERHWDILGEPEQMSWEEIEEVQGHDWWIEFDATFTKGKLDEIKLVKVTKDPIKDRLRSNKEWSEKRAKEAKMIHKRVINFLRKFSWYKAAIRGIIKYTNKAHSSLTKLLYKL